MEGEIKDIKNIEVIDHKHFQRSNSEFDSVGS